MRINKQDIKYDLKPETKPAFDRWTIRHFLGWTVLGLLKPDLEDKTVLALNIGSEIGEEFIAQADDEWKFRHEPIPNKIVDVIANQLGFMFGQGLRNEMFPPDEEYEEYDYFEEEYEEEYEEEE